LEVMVAAILDLFLSFSLSLSFSAATLDADVTVTGLALATLWDDDAETEVAEVADVEGDIPGEEVTDDDRDEALL